eukprot:2789676-Prymnesium_polylepis.1
MHSASFSAGAPAREAFYRLESKLDDPSRAPWDDWIQLETRPAPRTDRYKPFRDVLGSLVHVWRSSQRRKEKNEAVDVNYNHLLFIVAMTKASSLLETVDSPQA